MKIWRIVAVLLLCLALAGSVACNPFGGDEEETSQQLVEVVRGDLTVSVSGSGNIEVSNEAELAFGVGGKIDKIYVDEGDEVSKGDVLAKLDTGALELALTQAEVARAQAQVAVTQQQLAITQAQVALQTAEFNLDQARDLYTWSDTRVAQSEVTDAESYLKSALMKLAQATPGTESEKAWQKAVFHAQSRLNTAKNRLAAMLSGADPEEVAIKKLQVEVTKQSQELAQQSLELAQQSLELTQQSLEQAQKQLEEATLTAPLDGVVASVYADEGDTVSATMTIVHLIDPTTMELEAEVDEIDIPGVKLGQRAIIEIDALPDLWLEGEIISISTLSAEVGGVVLYEVTIGFDVPEDVGLKTGMSASSDIVISERSNVLLVPSRAITQDSQGNPVVKVMVNEQIVERLVVTGISDGFETEIVEGLGEGEAVVIERRAG